MYSTTNGGFNPANMMKTPATPYFGDTVIIAIGQSTDTFWTLIKGQGIETTVASRRHRRRTPKP